MFVFIVQWDERRGTEYADRSTFELYRKVSEANIQKNHVLEERLKFKTDSDFSDNFLQWRRQVRRFSLFERKHNSTSKPFHMAPTVTKPTSYRRILKGDRFMLLPHGKRDPGCYFFDRLDKWGMPLVHSVFADQVDRRVIITGVRRPTKDYSWHLEKFRCEFYPPGVVPRNNSETMQNYSQFVKVPTDPMIKDEQKVGAQPQGVFIITCSLPNILYDVDVFKMNLRRLTDDSLAHHNITVCRSLPKDYKPHFLSICTMLKNMDKYVPDWLEFHKQLGVERAYIYDNAMYSTLVSARGIKRYIDSGFLTIIPWSHTYSKDKTYLETQIASENDCLWRHRHDATWMIKTDVDEFLQPMSKTLPRWLPAYLNQSFLSNLAGVRLQNWFFCQFDKKLNRRARRLDGGQGDTVFHRNLYRARDATPINKGRDKSIVRPDRVHYFKIHAIKWGGDILSFDPNTEIRMVHYRGDNPRHPSFCPKVVVKDSGMLDLWNQLVGNKSKV
ncbi:hypothetical protein HOLleu_32036 [Holothuria leucospilota]|uniref:Glycosyltransferase family 92 protein n=1 Tax=Holothuria leucospilota TaxID=206669 RepID=A0A9Q0YR31_HOLLE|nr:hypothetical protein HOLleu_32036 [Holothuria leucospilota]